MPINMAEAPFANAAMGRWLRPLSRLSDGGDSGRDSPWSDGHETELRRQSDKEASRWYHRAQKAEDELAQLKAATAGREGAVRHLKETEGDLYTEAAVLRCMMRRWDPRNWAALAVHALKGDDGETDRRSEIASASVFEPVLAPLLLRATACLKARHEWEEAHTREHMGQDYLCPPVVPHHETAIDVLHVYLRSGGSCHGV